MLTGARTFVGRSLPEARRFARYLIVGAAANLFGLAIYYLATLAIGVEPKRALTLASAIAFVPAYAANRAWTFRSNAGTARSLLRYGAGYAASFVTAGLDPSSRRRPSRTAPRVGGAVRARRHDGVLLPAAAALGVSRGAGRSGVTSAEARPKAAASLAERRRAHPVQPSDACRHRARLHSRSDREPSPVGQRRIHPERARRGW